MNKKYKKESNVERNGELSKSNNKKNKIFFIVTLLIPVLFFFFLELILQFAHYGGDLHLFIDGPTGYEQYYRCNPNVARRYFTVQSVIPTPPNQLFLKKKPTNGYRIFVLGESSAAGFPYSANASFPNILWRALSETFPDKYIEVINLSLSAINSYALLDFIDEIIQQSPDAILIYAGHNEYYGALGVGSSQNLGTSRTIIKSYLALNFFRTFLFLRDVVGWIKLKISLILYEGSVVDPSATLMENIVAEQIIPYKSHLYELGKKQFHENLSEIYSKTSKHKIAVVIGELVSNLRDQPPFISVNDSIYGNADETFKKARQLDSLNEYVQAKTYYLKAKDLDALRFRASEEFNEIIRKLSMEFNQPCVPLVKVFENSSPNGLIGNSLMHEHLHPNKQGYCLIAKAFYETMRSNGMISSKWNTIDFKKVWESGITELDSVYAELVVRHLKGSWPFQPKGLPNKFADEFKPKNYLELLAFNVLPNDSFNLEAAHLQLAKEYEKQKMMNKALAEYKSLIASIPQECEFYNKAATILLIEQKYDSANIILKQSLRYGSNPFAYKWIGQIALMKNDLETAIEFLGRADLWDAQVLFNLSKAFYLNNQIAEADKHYQRLKIIAPKSEYAAYLQKLQLLTKMKQTNRMK